MSEPLWLTFGRRYLGMKEIPGAPTAPIIDGIKSGDYSFFTAQGVNAQTVQIVHNEFVIETCDAADFQSYKDTFLAGYTQIGVGE